MTESANTSLTIRVQAKGGMFLGLDSFNGAIITIRDVASKKLLAEPAFTNQGDSGTRESTYTPAATPFPIITPRTTCSPPALHWVVASGTTVNCTANFELPAPALLEVEAIVPLPKEQGDQCIKTQVWVVPGQQPTSVPGVVVEIPGLWAQPEFVVLGATVNLKTKVTMMCGCEINYDSPWVPSDFEVQASIWPTAQGEAPIEVVPLSFRVNSQFTGQTSTPLAASDYMAVISARQISTQNCGEARMKIHVLGSK